MMNADFENIQTVSDYLDDVVVETVFDRVDVVFPDGTILVQSTGERVEDHGEKIFETLIAKGSHISQ